MIDKYLEKLQNKKLDLLNTFFVTAYKSFYGWCSIDKKVSVVLAVSILALNAGIGIGTSLVERAACCGEN